VRWALLAPLTLNRDPALYVGKEVLRGLESGVGVWFTKEDKWRRKKGEEIRNIHLKKKKYGDITGR
jgi:hypothetical protein